MVIAVGEYGDSIIVSTEFPTLPDDSPQRYEVEHSIFQHYEWAAGVHAVSCTLWFFKDVRNINTVAGKLLGVTSRELSWTN